MSSAFSSSSSGDAWLRVGRLEVTTTVAVVAITIATWFAWLIVPGGAASWWLTPSQVFSGGIWRIVTWPMAGQLSFSAVLNLLVFWFIGKEMETQIGRAAMARFLVGLWASLTAATLVVGALLGGGLPLAGLGQIEFLMLLIWIIDAPRRPLFFGLQAWVFGAILVGLQLIGLAGAGGWSALLALVLAFGLALLVARRAGLLMGYPRIPGRGTGLARARESRAQVREQQRSATDRERLDSLLDRISEQGLDSLSPRERKELLKLRERLRGSR